MEMAKAAEENGALITASSNPPDAIGERPFLRPNFAAEWKLLKKAWSLHRNDREKLSRKRISEASRLFYKSDPLQDLRDWLWRFVLFLGQPSYEPKFLAIFKEIEVLKGSAGFEKFITYYDKKLSVDRGGRYFELMKEYFANFSEFGQVYFHVSRGYAVPDGNVASSTDFHATKMFYGNAFEVFASSVDIFAYLNNLAMGRSFSTFESMTQEKYLALDKASRFRAFSVNAAFTALCEERDNQLRNASHHGSCQFDVGKQEITYRSGKGGAGPEKRVGYASYLARSTKLFLQVTTLLRAEILMCHIAEKRAPL